MKKRYEPVACALHDEYESAIMRRQKLTISWMDDAGRRREEVILPIDLRTCEGEEFLIACLEDTSDDPLELTIRLDKITLLGQV